MTVATRLTDTCACPEASATLAALEQLPADGWVSRDEEVVLFYAGTGLRFSGVIARPS
jgi:threonine synthase